MPDPLPRLGRCLYPRPTSSATTSRIDRYLRHARRCLICAAHERETDRRTAIYLHTGLGALPATGASAYLPRPVKR